MSLIPAVPQREVAVPGNSTLKLRIYGVDKARDLGQVMAQAVCVLRDGTAVPRAELTEAERSAVKAYLETNHPEHATL